MTKPIKECTCRCHYVEVAKHLCTLTECKHCHPSERGIEKLKEFKVYTSDSVELSIAKQNRDKINQIIDIINTLKL